MKNLKIEITIPVLNEESRLENGITKTVEFLEDSRIRNYVIIIADNGSTDNTEIIGLQLSKKYPNVEVIKLKKRGVGLALKYSWGSSDADLIGYMDVDLATDLNHLIEMYQAFQNDEIDVIAGSRLLPNSQVKNRSIIRGITSYAFNYLLKNILDVNISDGMCGFKFLKRESYEKILKSGLENNDWFFCAELLIKADWIGMKIYEIPVKWRDNKDSRVELGNTIMKYIKEIKRLRPQKPNKLK